MSQNKPQTSAVREEAVILNDKHKLEEFSKYISLQQQPPNEGFEKYMLQFCNEQRIGFKYFSAKSTTLITIIR